MTQRFAVINSQGRILRTGRAPADMISMQAREGEQAVIVQTMPDAQSEKYDNGQWVPLSDAEKEALRTPITSEHVNAERARRVAAGTIINVSGYGAVALEGRVEDRVNLSGLKDVAKEMIETGDTTTTRQFRDRDNVDHDLTAPQIVELWRKGVMWTEAIYQKSWVLKSMDPIPRDYTDEGYWT